MREILERVTARVKAKILHGSDAWCVPATVVTAYLEPLAVAVEKKKAEAAGREGRTVLMAYARCLESEEGKARRAESAASRKSLRKSNACGRIRP